MLGLLTLGSSYKPRLPAQLAKGSGFVRRSSPITAAGPYRNFTGFPFMARRPTLGCETAYFFYCLEGTPGFVKRTILLPAAVFASQCESPSRLRKLRYHLNVLSGNRMVLQAGVAPEVF